MSDHPQTPHPELAELLQRSAEHDRLPDSWPSASKIWWRHSLVRRLDEDTVTEPGDGRVWASAVGIAVWACAALVAINLVLWQVLARLLSAVGGVEVAAEPWLLAVCIGGILMPAVIVPGLFWLLLGTLRY